MAFRELEAKGIRLLRLKLTLGLPLKKSIFQTKAKDTSYSSVTGEFSKHSYRSTTGNGSTTMNLTTLPIGVARVFE